MTESTERVTVGLRLASMLVDHFAMTIIIMLIAMPGFAIIMKDAFELNHEPMAFGFGGMSVLMGAAFSAYFNKDVFGARSPAKRILKLQVIDNETNEAASPFKCLVRNLTIPVWPLEVLFVLINPKRRLGDRIAGTRIDYVLNPVKTKIEWPKTIIVILIAIGFTMVFTLPLTVFNSHLETEKVAYVESSYDKVYSEKTNELFKSELNDLIGEADFRIYNQIENDDRKYVAAILYFKYKFDYENFDESEAKIADLLTSTFPLDDYVCFVKFVHKAPGTMSTRQKTYDNEKNK